MNAAHTANAGAKIARLEKLYLSLDCSGYEDLLKCFKGKIKEAKTIGDLRNTKDAILKLEAKIELLEDLKRDNFKTF